MGRVEVRAPAWFPNQEPKDGVAFGAGVGFILNYFPDMSPHWGPPVVYGAPRLHPIRPPIMQPPPTTRKAFATRRILRRLLLL